MKGGGSSTGLGSFKIDTLIHYALVFFIGMSLGAAITYFGFEGSFTDYRKAQNDGQKLEVMSYLKVLEHERMTDTEVRDTLKSMMKNKVQYFKEMEQQGNQ